MSPAIRTGTIYRKKVAVSPAYGYIKSALVKCSNEGGLGPRFNMKGDHGSSIFNRQVVYYLNLLTSSRKQMTGRQGWANLDQAHEDLDRNIFRDLSPTPKP